MDPTSNKFTESEKLLWGNNKYTPNNLNAQFVTAANLNVLTDYVKNTYGSQHRIILSEQGFDAKGGEDYQAASLAYTFYAGQFNDMVDAVIFRSWEDHPDDLVCFPSQDTKSLSTWIRIFTAGQQASVWIQLESIDGRIS